MTSKKPNVTSERDAYVGAPFIDTRTKRTSVDLAKAHNKMQRTARVLLQESKDWEQVANARLRSIESHANTIETLRESNETMRDNMAQIVVSSKKNNRAIKDLHEASSKRETIIAAVSGLLGGGLVALLLWT